MVMQKGKKMKRKIFNKRSAILISGLCASAISVSSFAADDSNMNADKEMQDKQNYASAGVQVFNFNHDNFSARNTTAILLKFGRDIGDDLDIDWDGDIAIEAHLNVGADFIDDNGEEIVANTTIAKSEVDIGTSFSLFAKGDLPISEDFDIYGLVGVTKADVDLKVGNNPDQNFDDTGLAYGVGVNLDLSDGCGLAIEAINHDVNDNYRLVSANATINFSF